MSTTAPDERITKYNPVVPTTEFPALFPIFATGDISVFIDGVEREDFTVTASYVEGVSNDAKVIMNSGVTGNVIIAGDRDPRRQSRFGFGSIAPRDLNLALDTLEGEMQEARRDINRSVRTQIGDHGLMIDPGVADGDTLMKLGDKIVPGPNAEHIRDAEANAERAEIAALSSEEAADRADAAASNLQNIGAIFDTLVEVQAATVDPSVDVIRINGRAAASDYGGVHASYVAVEPSHGGKVKSGNNRWFEFKGKEIRFEAFGGVLGTSTNDAAWTAAKSWAVATGGVVRFRTGTYGFATSTDFDVAVSSDGGTVLESAAIGLPPKAKVEIGTFSFKSTSAVFGWAGKSETLTPISAGDVAKLNMSDADRSEIFLVNLAAAEKVTVAWPLTNAGYTSISNGVTSGATFASFDVALVPNLAFNGVMVSPVLGHTYEADVRTWAGDIDVNAVLLRSDTYSYVAYHDRGNPKVPRLAFRNKLTGITTDFALIDLQGANTQQGMLMRYARLGVELIDANKFAILLNGVPIYVGGTAGGEALTGVGFGFYSDKTSGSVGVNYCTDTINDSPGARPLNILCFGDSTGDGMFNTWPAQMVDILHGSAGAYVRSMTNIAHTGDNAYGQQLALQANGLSGINIVVGLVGANDIQGQTDITGFHTVITDIINYCHNGGVPLVLAVPPLFYSQAEALQYGTKPGAAAVNGHLGAVFRGAIAAAVATAREAGKRVHLVDLTKSIPPVFTRYLDGGGAGGKSEAMVADNIHPGGVMARWIAAAIARKVLSAISPDAKIGVSAPIPAIWFRNGWTNASGFVSRYWIDAGGIKHLTLNLQVGSDTTDGVTILQLPPVMRPKTTEYRAGSNGSTTAAQIQIDVNGLVKAYRPTGGYICVEASYD